MKYYFYAVFFTTLYFSRPSSWFRSFLMIFMETVSPTLYVACIQLSVTLQT